MDIRTLTLAKDGHSYVFRYPAGHENKVIDHLMELAQADQTNFDWLDAATLCFQVTQTTAQACDEVIHSMGEDS